MTPTRSLAAAQTIPLRGDVDANVAQHLRLARVAAEEHVEVLVFPELSLTGYEIGLAPELAFSPDDSRLAPLIDVASSRAMTLIVGAPARVGTRLHVGAFIVSPSGRVELYTKQHLGAFPPSASVDGNVPPAEATVFHPGDRDPLVELDGSVAAVAVCADTGRPSHPRHAAARGARTYLASMFVIPSDFARETENLRASAREHRMTVVFANFGGPSGALATAGGSAIWDDTGKCLVQIEGTGIGLAIAIESEAAGWRGRVTLGDGTR